MRTKCWYRHLNGAHERMILKGSYRHRVVTLLDKKQSASNTTSTVWANCAVCGTYVQLLLSCGLLNNMKTDN